jgi:drug/metabolite transporter (DMT)-like permease
MPKTFLVVAVAALSASVGETLLAYGMRSFGDRDWSRPSHWLELVLVVARNRHVMLGVLFLAGFFFLYLAALSWADVSFVTPLTSLSFVFGAILAKVALGEDVGRWRWIGVAVIVLGISLFALDGRPRTIGTAAGAAAEVERR